MAKRSRAAKRAPRVKDVAILVHPTEDQEGFHVLRRRDEDSPVEVGTIRPLREGRPIDGEVVSLHQRKDFALAFDVKVEVADQRATSGGPAQVATDQYRAGWDQIWGSRPQASSGGRPN
jgi:hypothetical protein